MVEGRRTFSVISGWNHCQRSSSPSGTYNTLRAGFEPTQSLNSGFVKWSCAVVITTTPRRLRFTQFFCHHNLIWKDQLVLLFNRLVMIYHPVQQRWSYIVKWKDRLIFFIKSRMKSGLTIIHSKEMEVTVKLPMNQINPPTVS